MPYRPIRYNNVRNLGKKRLIPYICLLFRIIPNKNDTSFRISKTKGSESYG